MAGKKENIEVKITTEYIELIALLKYVGIAESGGFAKQMVDDGAVKLNGQPESRKRAKIKPGDVVGIGSYLIHVSKE